ncbi:MAG: helix-turn-helix domain-containing protein [Acetobacteraceae bacterium]
MEAARAAFTESGPDVALEEIARRAGVGIGTLYRHFPTRDVLLAEVYRHGVEQLAETATRCRRRRRRSMRCATGCDCSSTISRRSR